METSRGTLFWFVGLLKFGLDKTTNWKTTSPILVALTMGNFENTEDWFHKEENTKAIESPEKMGTEGSRQRPWMALGETNARFTRSLCRGIVHSNFFSSKALRRWCLRATDRSSSSFHLSNLSRVLFFPPARLFLWVVVAVVASNSAWVRFGPNWAGKASGCHRWTKPCHVNWSSRHLCRLSAGFVTWRSPRLSTTLNHTLDVWEPVRPVLVRLDRVPNSYWRTDSNLDLLMTPEKNIPTTVVDPLRKSAIPCQNPLERNPNDQFPTPTVGTVGCTSCTGAVLGIASGSCQVFWRKVTAPKCFFYFKKNNKTSRSW